MQGVSGVGGIGSVFTSPSLLFEFFLPNETVSQNDISFTSSLYPNNDYTYNSIN